MHLPPAIFETGVERRAQHAAELARRRIVYVGTSEPEAGIVARRWRNGGRFNARTLRRTIKAMGKSAHVFVVVAIERNP